MFKPELLFHLDIVAYCREGCNEKARLCSVCVFCLAPKNSVEEEEDVGSKPPTCENCWILELELNSGLSTLYSSAVGKLAKPSDCNMVLIKVNS